MWLCLSNGFLSVVKNKYQQNLNNEIVVRARERNHLEFYFPDKVINSKLGTDYQFRIFLSKIELKDFIDKYIAELNYDNFKSSVKDYKLRHLFTHFWQKCLMVYF